MVTEYLWPVYIARKMNPLGLGHTKPSRHWMGLFDIYEGVNLVRYEPKSINMLASFPQTLQILVSCCIFFLTPDNSSTLTILQVIVISASLPHFSQLQTFTVSAILHLLIH
jgi:hypothetical protein